MVGAPPRTLVACLGGGTGSGCVLVTAHGVATVPETFVVTTLSAALLVAQAPTTGACQRV